MQLQGCIGWGGRAVNRISEHWATNRLEMDTDLVGASGLQSAADQHSRSTALDDLALCRRGLAVVIDLHANAVGGVPGDRGFDAESSLIHMPGAQSYVPALRRLVLDLAGKRSMRAISLRDQHKTRGVLVQPVHDSRTETSRLGAQLLAICEKYVHQARLFQARCGVAGQSARFVDDEHVRIFKDKLELAGRRCEVVGGGVFELGISDRLTWMHRVTRLENDQAVNGHKPIRDCRRNLGAAEPRFVADDEYVQPLLFLCNEGLHTKLDSVCVRPCTPGNYLQIQGRTLERVNTIMTNIRVLALAVIAAGAAFARAGEVSIAARGERLARVVELLGTQIGKTLTVQAALANEVIYLRAEHVDSDEVLKQISRAVMGTWRDTKEGAILVKDDAAWRTQDRSEISAAGLQIKAALDKRLDEIQGEYTAENANRAWEIMQDMSSQAGVGRGGPRGGGGPQRASGNPQIQNMMNELNNQNPGVRALVRALATMNPNDIASLPIGGRVVFSTRPTGMQRTLSTSVLPIAERAISEGAIYRDTMRSLAGQDRVMMFGGGPNMGWDQDPASGQIGNVLVILQRGGFGPQIRASFIVVNQNGESMVVQTDGVNPASQTITVNNPKADDTQVKFTPEALAYAQIVNSQVPAGGFAGRAVVVTDTGNGSRPVTSVITNAPEANLVRVADEVKDAVLNPEKRDPLSYFVAEALDALAAVEGKPFIALVPDRLVNQVAAMAISGTVTVAQVKSALTTVGRMSFGENSGWLTLEPIDIVAQTTRRVDRSALGTTLRTLNANGNWSLEQTAAYIASCPKAMGQTNFDFGTIGAICPLALSGDGLFANLDILAFYGSLSSSQQTTLKQTGALALGGLTGPQRDQLNALIFHSEDGPRAQSNDPNDQMDRQLARRGIQMMRGQFRFGDERTVRLAQGVPSQAVVQLKMETEQGAMVRFENGRVSVMDPGEVAMARLRQDGGGPSFPGFNAAPQAIRDYAPAEVTNMQFTFVVGDGYQMVRELQSIPLAKSLSFGSYDRLPEAFRKAVDEDYARRKEQADAIREGNGRGAGIGGGPRGPGNSAP